MCSDTYLMKLQHKSLYMMSLQFYVYLFADTVYSGDDSLITVAVYGMQLPKVLCILDRAVCPHIPDHVCQLLYPSLPSPKICGIQRENQEWVYRRQA